MMRTLNWLALWPGILGVVLGIPAFAQTFDTSGNGTLKGDYFVRQVLVMNLDQNTSAIGRAVSLTGIMTFDGNGGYTFSGQMMDSKTGATQAYSVSNGQYALQSNGLLQLQNPFDNATAATDFGAVGAIGPSAIVASSTEGQYDDILVAIPVASAATNNSVQGSFRVGFIDFLQANASQVRDGYYTLTSTGNGSFGNVTVNGAMANQGSTQTTQALSSVAYSIGANGNGTITFPTSPTPLNALVSGPKNFNISADGNILLGGSLNGFDIVVGIKAAAGVSNSTYQGTYFIAGLENDASDVSNGNNFIDSFSGSTLALGQGNTISHYRLVLFNQNAYDYTADGAYNFGTDGSGQKKAFADFLGVGGQAGFQVGTSTFYTLTVSFQSKAAPAGSVVIDPVKVWNAASFAPITNSVSPGEYVSLFGSGLSPVILQAQSLPLSTNLGGVQLSANGRMAPLGYVSPTQINFLVPYATTENYLTLQVINNGVPSNKVTVYTNLTSPGVFALTQNGGSFAPGIGPAAVTHADNTLVTPANPAKAGETLQLYVTGLGLVTPRAVDGVAASTTTLSTVDAAVVVDIQDQNFNLYAASVAFKGLAPGFVGLYQVNFVVPSGVPSGLAWVNVGTPDSQTPRAYTSEAKLYMK
jgi:uncharacterized protein (TIGR03437 family)